VPWTESTVAGVGVHGSFLMVTLHLPVFCVLIRAANQDVDDWGGTDEAAVLDELSRQRKQRLTGAQQPGCSGAWKATRTGQNGEKVIAYSPRWLELSGRQWFRSAMTASLSKRKRMAVALLGDLSAVVKGRTGVARHGEAPQLVGKAWEMMD
jgi:hypothetical protein